ncbi:MOSC domain-containing protein [Streptomyces eurythermus]|uniref:MOSC domain-containing protein n=1 Tax=Streptomyces eurythermus TaxID=42237 RepID=UPI0037016CD2
MTTSEPSAASDVRVAGLRRYPVKSMRGEDLTHADFTARGMTGDRSWAVTFPDGRVGSGKSWKHVRRVDGLLGYTAETADDRVRVRTPDDRVLAAGDPDLDEELSRLAGTAVHLGREQDVSHFDCAAVHLLSRPALARLAARMPAEARQVLVDRFRPNLLLDGESFLEDDWVGAKVAVGPEVVLEITERTERCVMTTLPQAGLPAARTVLRTLVEEFDTCLGVYARVITGGRAALADPVRVC